MAACSAGCGWGAGGAGVCAVASGGAVGGVVGAVTPGGAGGARTMWCAVSPGCIRLLRLKARKLTEKQCDPLAKLQTFFNVRPSLGQLIL